MLCFEVIISYSHTNNKSYGIMIEGPEIKLPEETVKSSQNSFITFYLFLPHLRD